MFEVVKNALEKYSKCANLNESCDDPGTYPTIKDSRGNTFQHPPTWPSRE